MSATYRRQFLFWVVLVLGMPIGLAVGLFLIGWFLPADHVVARAIELDQPPEKVWQVITDFGEQPSWRADLKEVKRVAGEPDTWLEVYRGGDRVRLQTVDAQPPRKLVRRIVDDGGPFSGAWEMTLKPQGDGCRLTITEQGQINSAFGRLAARFLFSPAAFVEIYLQQLAVKFEEFDAPILTVEPKAAESEERSR